MRTELERTLELLRDPKIRELVDKETKLLNELAKTREALSLAVEEKYPTASGPMTDAPKAAQKAAAKPPKSKKARKTRRAPNQEKVLKALEKGEVSFDDLLQATGIESQGLSNSIYQLKVKKKVEKTENNTYRLSKTKNLKVEPSGISKDIYALLEKTTAPLLPHEIAHTLKVKPQQIYKQLGRLVESGHLKKNTEGRYSRQAS